MSKKMLIDASHPEETRVVIVDGTRIEELDFESANKKQLRGNLYLARVTRVEPSLQAAFVEYGGNRHGFLAFSEIHPDYYQIPYEDRMALLEAQEAEALEEAAEEEEETEKPSQSKPKKDAEASDDESEEEASDEADDDESDDDESDDTEEDSEEESGDETDDDVADEQEKTARKRRNKASRHRYKIQEVIKRGQILLIQVVKEERGNKGAAMTTYLSLAGRYCVLMPNTPKGGGISRKIANGSDRKRLKSIVSEFEVPQGMGVIVRTAGAKRTKTEIKRDYDYLSRLWTTIRETTLKSIAPALIHEEGNLVKRSIRDLYNKDVSEILVQGDEAYKTAKNFIKMLMPSHAKNVKAYKDSIPLFLRYQIENQLENSLDSLVQLKSGGYLVIHPTEALVSIDVNSGRATKERNVERTALKTNLEAAEEVARQMRLRDLAGLVVIDFIDMDENRNNRAVEKKMKEALSRDRARVQASRISQFGLMEISRQRRRRSLLEGSTVSCPHCQGVGRKRTVESSALRALRAVEEKAARGQAAKARLSVDPDVAAFILNHKRDQLNTVQELFGMYTIVEADTDLLLPEYALTVVDKASGKNPDPLAEIEKELKKANNKRKKSSDKKKSNKENDADDADEVETDDEEDTENRKRRRRGRRGGRRRGKGDKNREAETEVETGSEESPQDGDVEESIDKTEEKPKKSRRRNSKRKSDKTDESSDDKEAAADVETKELKEKPAPKKRRRTTKKSDDKKSDKEVESGETSKVKDDEVEEKPKPKKRSTTRRKAPSRKKADDAETAEVEAEKPAEAEKTEEPKKAKKPVRKPRTRKKADAEPAEKPSEKAAEDSAVEEKADKPKRRGWWQKRK